MRRHIRIARKLLAVLAATLFVAGCATQTLGVRDRLDLQTGVTVTYSGTPLIMYRENPSQAAYARNYVHVGPIQVNRSGNYEFFLWFSAWNTMQTPDAANTLDGLESVIVFADGEPLTLEFAGSTPATVGTSEPVYLKPVALAADAYYRVTADQIRLIADATDLRIRTTGARPREFEPWDAQIAARNDLQEFLRRTLF